MKELFQGLKPDGEHANYAGAEAPASAKLLQQAVKSRLHWDGVFGVAGNVPAGAVAALGEEGTRAGHVFFGLLNVDLVFDAVSLVGNGKQADAVNAGSGGAKAWQMGTQREPQEIANIKEKKKGGRREVHDRARWEVTVHGRRRASAIQALRQHE
jgi:hypothetical protein